MIARCLAAFLFGVATSGPGFADGTPDGWSDCRAAYPQEGAAACIALLRGYCATGTDRNTCLMDQAGTWMTYDVNANFRHSGRPGVEGDRLQAIAEASFRSSPDLDQCAKEDAECHLEAIVTNALANAALRDDELK